MTHRYFVSYAFERARPDGAIETGYGNAEVTVSTPIRGMGEVEEIERQLQREQGHSGVVVLSWRRFEGEFGG